MAKRALFVKYYKVQYQSLISSGFFLGPKWGKLVIFEPKIKTFQFFSPLNMFMRFFLHYSWWYWHLKYGQKGLLWILKKNSCNARNEINGSSVKTRGSIVILYLSGDAFEIYFTTSRVDREFSNMFYLVQLYAAGSLCIP